MRACSAKKHASVFLQTSHNWLHTHTHTKQMYLISSSEQTKKTQCMKARLRNQKFDLNCSLVSLAIRTPAPPFCILSKLTWQALWGRSRMALSLAGAGQRTPPSVMVNGSHIRGSPTAKYLVVEVGETHRQRTSLLSCACVHAGLR